MTWFPCRVGWHRWYLDAALISSAYLCSRCGKPQNEAAALRLGRERVRLANLPGDASLADMYRAAAGLRVRSKR